eukprot:g9259.t1
MSNNASIREIFDDISLSVINFLENHEGVASVDFVERRGITLAEITAWEQDNAPYSLPNDYKAFLLISNGLLLRWHIRHHDSEFPLGCLHLNKLASVQRIARNDEDSDDELEEMLVSDAHNDPSESKTTKNDMKHFGSTQMINNEKPNHYTPSRKIKRGPRGRIRRTLKRLPRDSAAFDIDNTCTGGTVAFFYSSKDNFDNPQVWFQDMSCKWFFIANTFTDYFRLMIMHLGLPCWQYAFTEVGLDPVSQQWFRFLSPERLAIDIDNCKMQKVHKLQAHSLKTAVHPLKKQQLTTLVDNRKGSMNANSNDRNGLQNSTRNPSKNNVNSNRTRGNKGRLEHTSHNAQTNMGHHYKNTSQRSGSGTSRGSNQSYSNAGRDRLKRPQSAPSNRRYNGNGSTRGKKLFG